MKFEIIVSINLFFLYTFANDNNIAINNYKRLLMLGTKQFLRCIVKKIINEKIN